jgi:hypothetical protein
LSRFARSPEAVVVLLGAVSLLVLGPLRGLVDIVPLVPFLAALFLFMAPGLLLVYWFLREGVPGAAVVPVGFAISTGAFGLMGIPMLMLNTSTETYLLFAGATVAAFLVSGALVALFRPAEPVKKGDDVRPDVVARLLWVPFSLLGAALAFVAWAKIPNLYDDMWVYLSYVRGFVDSEALARYEPYFGQENGLSRVKVNGWLLEQAALARVSGIDPIVLVLKYLNPALVVVALLAFYALARTLFKSEAAALLAGSLCALYFLIHLGESILPPGSEFAVRLAEDKYAARFIFLPVALMMAAVFLESRKRRYLLVFGFLCWTSVAVHPVGLAIIALSTVGLCIVHLAVNRRERTAWANAVGLGVAGCSVALMPVLIRVATGIPFADLLKSADINDGIPEVLANMVFVRPYRERIYELEPGLYIMHPSLILDPVILAAFVLGVPFLLWRLKRSLTAQILLGTLLFATAVVYVPQIATFMGDNVVVPGQLHRLAWPIPLAALLIIGWMAWETTRYAQDRFGDGPASRALRYLPLFLVVALSVAATPAAVAGAKEIYESHRVGPDRVGLGFDPIFPWLRDNIDEPAVIMAPDAENTFIPAWSDDLNVVSRRGKLVLEVLPALEERAGKEIRVPQGSLDVRDFYGGVTLERGIEILRRHEVDYVMVMAGSALDEDLRRLRGFTPVETPGERYALYSVDREELGG